MDLPARLVFATHRFLNELTKHYGADKGTDMYNSLLENNAPDLQLAVLKSMMTPGGLTDEVTVKLVSADANNGTSIDKIKAIRAASMTTAEDGTPKYLPLREAKTIYDTVKNGFTGHVKIHLTEFSDLDVAIRTLKDAGYTVEE